MSPPAEDAIASGVSQPPVRRPRTPRRWILPAVISLFAAALVAVLIYGVMAQPSNSSIDAALSRGRSAPAPAFDLPVLSRGSPGGRFPLTVSQVLARRSLSLRALRGTPVVLNMWASWCLPCRQEAPTLEREWRTLGRPRAVLFLGLDTQDASVDALGFVRRYAIDYPNVHDAGDDVPRAYGATGVPETFFITARGRVVGHIIGLSDRRQLAEGIKAAVSGTVGGTTASGPRRALR